MEERGHSDSDEPVVLSYGSKQDGRVPKGSLVVWLLIGIPVVFLLVGILVPALFRPRVYPVSYTTKCLSNLRQIGVAVHVYAAENKGSLPDSWDVLLKSRYELLTANLSCPATKAGVPRYGVIVHEGPVKRPGTTPMMFEPLGNHKIPGASVLFVDGHAEWVKPDRYRKLLEPYVDLQQ